MKTGHLLMLNPVDLETAHNQATNSPRIFRNNHHRSNVEISGYDISVPYRDQSEPDMAPMDNLKNHSHIGHPMSQ